MKKIDDQIQWYKQNSNSLYDDIVSIELEKINSLYDRYEDHTDEIFVDEIIESFCKIIERQRDKIHDLETESGMYNMTAHPLGLSNSTNEAESSFDFSSQPFRHRFIAFKSTPAENNGILQESFQNDKQLQDAFIQYCLINGKSSYTVNDYCSRIKNLWKSFYEEHQNGELPEELVVIEEKINPNCPLLNAYHHTDELHCFISMKIAGNDENRNWANTRAALNKFDEFKSSLTRNASI